jgi:hypothetical protein
MIDPPQMVWLSMAVTLHRSGEGFLGAHKGFASTVQFWFSTFACLITALLRNQDIGDSDPKKALVSALRLKLL